MNKTGIAALLALSACFHPVDPVTGQPVDIDTTTTTPPQRSAEPAPEPSMPDPAGLPQLFGVVREDCAPNDGPAFRFALAPEALDCTAFHSESMSVELWKSELDPGTYALSPSFDTDGTANVGGFAGTPVDEGSTLRIDAVVGEVVLGVLDASFGPSGKVKAKLLVTWCPSARQCG